ncbi:MAG: hypothetical protein IH948_07255 [Bacteroidetes bacterium]|nr:hypothetical protein [Bacteroidota bacterium]
MARELIKHPIDVTIENLGETVNSSYADYYPFVNADGTEIIFTSRKRRKGSRLDIDGYYPSNIYSLTMDKGQPVKVNSLHNVNSSLDERVVGFSKNGKKIFVYVDHDKYYGDLYYTQRGKSGVFMALKPMSEFINSPYVESSGSMSIDEDTYFFASDRPGGYGGLDLYMVRKLPDGSWSTPQNLGDKINTPYNEDYPNLSYNNSTLHFSSEGHINMGGYDLFKSEWNSESNEWTFPKNLGYPINTPDDNKMISFIEEEDIAYISLYKDGGFGDYDIYRATFNNMSKKLSLLRMSLELDKENIISESTLDITNSETGELYGTYISNQSSGIYTIILPPGEYEFFVEAEGYKPILKNYSILSGDDFKEFIQDTLQLSINN